VTARKKKRPKRPSTPARNPLLGPGLADTAHNLACALSYLNTAEFPGHPNEDLLFGRYLLTETVIHALETVRRESDE
jgi:hypothetical protein